MSITTTQLREAFEVLMKHLEETGRSAIAIEKDFYWDMSAQKLYNPYETPSEVDLDLGQLSDDWERLMEVASGTMPPVGYGLIWLAAILRYVGEETAA